MALSTAKTYLFYKIKDAVTAYAKLADIMNFPDMGSVPSKIDTTDLSAEKIKTSILGLQEVPDLTFEALYSETLFSTLSALTAKYDFQLQFGTAGADGMFEWTGDLRCFVMGGGVDEVRKISITTSAETEIVMAS